MNQTIPVKKHRISELGFVSLFPISRSKNGGNREAGVFIALQREHPPSSKNHVEMSKKKTKRAQFAKRHAKMRVQGGG